jgi:NTP pyrophosphatase (non-canonical NTP hydrolase)
MTDLDLLAHNIEKWAVVRGLDKANPRDQFLKVVEEVGEIAASMARGKQDELKDAIGDVFVTITILAMQNGLTIGECVEAAYTEIKGRTGKMVNGVFIKYE